MGFAPNLQHLELYSVFIQLTSETYFNLSTFVISKCRYNLFQAEAMCVLFRDSLQHIEPPVELKYLHALRLELEVSFTRYILSSLLRAT